MNSHIKHITLFIVSSVLISCSDFLDKEPLGSPTIDSYFTSLKNAEQSVIGAYNGLYHGGFQWGSMIFGDCCSDDAIVGGAFYNPSDPTIQLSLFQGKADDPTSQSYWNACFQLISKSNYVIKYVPQMTINQIDTIKSAQFVGEARFLRAYSYFLLVNAFGGVPLFTEPLLYSEYSKQSRDTEGNTWKFIENDLLEAKALFVKIKRKKTPLAELGRASLQTVNALLARVYLYQQKYALCQQVTTEIIKSNTYSLPADYASQFTIAGENSRESIFEIQFQKGNGGSEASVISWNVNSPNSQGLGFDCPTQDLVNEYEKGKRADNLTDWVDPRLEATVIKDNKSLTGYFNQKMYVNPADRTAPKESPKNLIIIRYADVLLMFAEAANRNGRSDTAAIVLNSVRKRARLMIANDPKILPDISAAIGVDELEKAIWHERRVEFAMEFNRFWDIKRQKRVGTVMRNFAETHKNSEFQCYLHKGEYFDDNIHNYFPIPQIDITLTGGKLIQNNGY